MKKLTLALSAAVAMAASGSAIASDSQNLIVEGSIQSVCTLYVDNQNPIALDDNSWQAVADIKGHCNSGKKNVKVSYLFTAFDDGDGFAKFMHNDPNSVDYVGYKARVLTTSGVTPIIGNPYTNTQGNGSTYTLEFEPQGDSSNIAGDYTTTLTVSVVP